MALPQVPSINLITERLPLIFPAGTPNQVRLISKTAVRTVFAMFYCGAVEGFDHWARPSQITGMSDEQASKLDETSRLAWIKNSLSSKKTRSPDSWYQSDSREQVRDEAIRDGLVPTRAIVVRPGVPTTSSKPRYALEAEFAALFRPGLSGEALATAIAAWQASHLAKKALSRVKLISLGAALAEDAIVVQLPTGSTRPLLPGPSSVIAKSVIEEFAPRFLRKPAVLWLSESGNKVDRVDDHLAQALGIKIDPSKMLPDIILVDIGEEASGADLLVVFVEIVASDGPVSESRKSALTELAADAGFDLDSLAFLTAFKDRSSAQFRKHIAELAWGSFSWCLSEPDHLIELREAAKDQRGILAPIGGA